MRQWQISLSLQTDECKWIHNDRSGGMTLIGVGRECEGEICFWNDTVLTSLFYD